MQVQLADQYTSAELFEARDEIHKLQCNLNRIEALYQHLYATLDEQQRPLDEIDASVVHAQSSMEKSDVDLDELLRIRKVKDKRRCLTTVFICTVAGVFLLIVVSVLVNVMNTFRFKSVGQLNGSR